MIEHINSMMYVIRTIHTTSRYYNTCEKVTALMVKVRVYCWFHVQNVMTFLKLLSIFFH